MFVYKKKKFPQLIYNILCKYKTLKALKEIKNKLSYNNIQIYNKYIKQIVKFWLRLWMPPGL